MNSNPGTEELQKLEAIEKLVSSLRDDMAGEATEALGSRMADKVATAVGSWKFLIGQSTCLVFYILYNVHLLQQEAFDPYPFILLNLVLSFQAAFTAPVILMAQNRADSKDRRSAKRAYKKIGHIDKLVKLLVQTEGAGGDQSSDSPSSTS